MPSKWDEVKYDLAIADSLKSYGVQPVKLTDPDSLKEVAPNGEKFKWVLTLSPELQLWAIPILDLKRPPVSNKDIMFKDDVIKHVIATRGSPVQSAGEAQLQGGKLVIDNGSGHYKPTPKSVEVWGKPAFVKVGFKLENIERHEFEKEQKYFK